jgi:nicotinamide-nucleotide amidase
MRAAIIAVGSELLSTTKLDTNSLRLARSLERFGVEVVRKSVVPDRVDDLIEELKYMLDRCELVITTGGLGPTEDDVTKEAISSALSLPLWLDPQILSLIEQRFTERGLTMPEVNRKQAMVFAGHRTLYNKRGTAPGFHLDLSHLGEPKHLFVLPGVPFELEGMLEHDLERWLRSTQDQSRFRRIVKVTGMTESQVEELLQPFYENHRGEPVTVLAGHGEVQIHLQADGRADDAFPRLMQYEQELHDLFGDRIFGLDDEQLESVVGRLLGSRGETVSTAESCTGGLIASRITDVSGSSAYFVGGVTAYTRDVKQFMLGVDPEVIDRDGEVSEEVARQLARGARRRFGTTYGIGVTGIAGPSGGSADKPVGTVHVSIASPTTTEHRKYLLAGSRELIKRYATQLALNMLRLFIVRGGTLDRRETPRR